MTIWRPSPSIRVKALGLVWRGAALLASEVPTDDGKIKGVRPLGGSVEFGECWQDALKREFREELGAEITLDGPPDVIENIYTHHGMTGHEVLFLSTVSFLDKSLYNHEEIQYFEDDGTPCTARWFELADLQQNGPTLYPETLLNMLLGK